MQTAKAVGHRYKSHENLVVLLVEAGKMYEDGHRFWISENGVWQVKHVPKEYLSVALWNV